MIDEIELADRLHALDVPVPAGLAGRCARRGRRRLLRRRLITTVGVAAAAVVVAGGSLAVAHRPAGRTSYVSTAAGPAAYAGLPCPRPERPTPDALLGQVCVPDPAPGFPVVRSDPSVHQTSTGYESGGSLVPAATFLLAATPGRVTDGGYGSAPTGSEATVLVTRKGTWPTTPDAVAARHLYRVTGTVTIDGATGTVVSVDGHQRGVFIELGGFDVQAFGSNVVGGPVPSVADLAALVDSIQHLGR